MRTNCNWFSGLMALLCLIATSSGRSSAADYPTKPVRLIVPFPAGATTEIPARLLAQKAAPRLGQMIVVDNRGGEEGRIGVELVSKAPADGYTIGVGTIGTLVIAPLVYTRMAYDAATAFALVSPMVTAPFLVVIHPAVPAATLKELIDVARAKPGQLNLAGTNVFARLVGEMFNNTAGVKMTYVPYPVTVIASTDLVAGRVQLRIAEPAAFRQDIQSGKLRALAVTQANRYAQLPTVPTTAEAGLPGFEVKTWFGLIAPKATPAAVVRLWNGEVTHALSQRDVIDSLNIQGFEASNGTPDDFAAMVGAERAKWSRVVATSGIKLD
jgi:tripartite-type tricarboxylate transporter receptor subunit TctC